MGLQSGKYTVSEYKEVIVWPAPDHLGNGEKAWINQTDNFGRDIGRMEAKDLMGREIRSYLPPEGFVNRPGYDHTDNYVKVDERGQVERTPSGYAIVIRPGTAIVLLPTGEYETLEDEYSQYVFAKKYNLDAGESEESDDTTEDAA